MASTTSGICVLGRNIAVRGTLVGEEDLVVEGRIEGNISLAGHLLIAETGALEADIEVASIEIHGEVVGDIVASRSVTIERGARVAGNVRAPRVIINDGAHFEGAVEMNMTLPDHLSKSLPR